MLSRFLTSRLLLVFILFNGAHAAQKNGIQSNGIKSNEPSTVAPVITIPKLTGAPKLEDFLTMKPAPGVAEQMAKVENFIQLDPKEGAPAQEKTEVYIGYDNKTFYAVFVCFDKEPGKIRARMTRREDIGPEHDEVQIYLDTFNDKRRSYGFMINPRGIQFDYIWTDNNGYDPSWDAVWDSAGKVTEQGYVAWMAIPFKSLRFPNTPAQTWGVIFQRVVPHDNDNSFYPRLTRKIQGRLTQEATLAGLRDISPGRNIQLNPYGVVSSFHNLDQRNPNFPFFTTNHLGGHAGLDAKMVLKDKLVLDATFNPDFRQLESDQPQITVNQRFEVFFPEKRPFFQENASYFDTPINLYFTRRIADPQFGLRLTGKLAEKWGIGLLAIDDQNPGRIVPDVDPNRRKRAYFTVGHLTREFGKQSHIGLFYADREFSADSRTACNASTLVCLATSNRVGGVDGQFKLGNNWTTFFHAVTSATDLADGTHLAGPAYTAGADYNSRHIFYHGNYNENSNGFRTATGFFRRPDVRRELDVAGYNFRPEKKFLTSWGPQVFENVAWDHEGNRLEYDVEPGINFNFPFSTDFGVFQGNTHELLKPSDFSTLTRNTDFAKGYWGGFFDSSYLKWLSVHAFMITAKTINFDPPSGQAPFLANETTSNVTLILHPWDPLTIQNDYLLERLRARITRAGILNSHTIRSKWNYQYNPRLSFRAIFQYDGLLRNPLYSGLDQTKNFNADFLITYLVHPGTAFYVGYNSNMENLDPFAISNHTGLFRTNKSYINDGRTVFAKISYLFRF